MMKSGDELYIEGNVLNAVFNGKKYSLVRFSKKFENVIANFRVQGYYPKSAKIRFIVAWTGEGDSEETVLIFPRFVLGGDASLLGLGLFGQIT